MSSGHTFYENKTLGFYKNENFGYLCKIRTRLNFDMIFGNI